MARHNSTVKTTTAKPWEPSIWDFESIYRIICFSNRASQGIFGIYFFVVTGVLIYLRNKSLTPYQTLIVFSSLVSTVLQFNMMTCIIALPGYSVNLVTNLWPLPVTNIWNIIMEALTYIERCFLVLAFIIRYIMFCRKWSRWYMIPIALAIVLPSIWYGPFTPYYTDVTELCQFTCVDDSNTAVYQVFISVDDEARLNFYDTAYKVENSILVVIEVFCFFALRRHFKKYGASQKVLKMQRRLSIIMMFEISIIVIINLFFNPILEEIVTIFHLDEWDNLTYGYIFIAEIINWFHPLFGFLIYYANKGFFMRSRENKPLFTVSKKSNNENISARQTTVTLT